jgi:hypothetical protein
MGWSVEELRFDSQQRQDMFLYFRAFKPALMIIQPHIQWVPRALAPRIKRPGREDEHSTSTSAEVKNNGLYLHFSVCIHGVVLN